MENVFIIIEALAIYFAGVWVGRIIGRLLIK